VFVYGEVPDNRTYAEALTTRPCVGPNCVYACGEAPKVWASYKGLDGVYVCGEVPEACVSLGGVYVCGEAPKV
jgi:hypothetical protein